MLFRSGLYGPHRDDFCLCVNDKSLYLFYSRGISRTFSILLKWQQLLLMRDKKQLHPILLLDDTFAELDVVMKEKLVGMIDGEAQVFYTSVIPQDEGLFTAVQRFNVSEGCLTHG